MAGTVPSPDGQRIEPAMPNGAYQTYQIVTPLSTHFRSATCEEVECDAYVNGFQTRVDEATDLGQAQAEYIRRKSGRRFDEDRDAAGLTVFTFPPGTKPFASDEHSNHKIRLERPEIYIRRPGDWRGLPRGERPFRHKRPDDWVEDFAEHQQGIADRVERG